MISKLGDICTIQSGGTPSRSKKDYWDNGTIPWVKISDFSGKYLDHTSEKITQAGLNGSSAKIFPKGTILYTIFATLGETCILDIDATTNQAIAGLKLNKDSVSLDYLYYYLLSKKEYVNEIGRGVAQNNINIKILREMEITIPHKEEQNKITDVLNKVYTLIALRKEQLLKLDELVTSRFIEMFGDPIDNPKGLPVKTLKELSTLITNGNTPKGGSKNYIDKGILFLRSQNVWRNRIELDDVAYIDEATHHSLKKSSLKHKDILITKTGRINTENSSLGRAALYLGEDDSANINGHVYLVRLDRFAVPEYVVAILTSEAYRKYIRKVCVGGIDKRQINLDQVEDFPIILPPIYQQQQFAAFVEQIDKSKLAIQKSLDKLETLKKALMRKYFG